MALYNQNAFPQAPDLLSVSVAIPAAGSDSLIFGTLDSADAIMPSYDLTPIESFVTFPSGFSSTDDAYKNKAIRIVGGTGIGARGVIQAYKGDLKKAVVRWGTGYSQGAGIPTALDNTSQFELSIDCAGKGKLIVLIEYSNATASASISVALRDGNGRVLDTAKITPDNLGVSVYGSGLSGAGFRGRGFEIPVDGMDTAFLQVEEAASGGVSPSISAWVVAVYAQ